MASSPDGRSVYVAGISDGDPSSASDADIAVIAFDTETGERQWAARYPGAPGFPLAAPFALVASPTGSAVFVAATVYSADGSASAIATLGFAAATGAELWSALLAEPKASTTDAAISPDGLRVYVAGETSAQAVTLAYDAATGQQVWLSRYAGDPGDRTLAFKVVANPDGSRVYVAGGKIATDGYTVDVLLLVYDHATGALLRETHHPTRGVPPAGIAVSPDGSRVFIEEANLETSLNNALTLAYDAAGTKLWTARFQGCDDLKCSARPWYYGPITVSPDGSRVFVTSLGVNHLLETGFMTVAYDAATGAQHWVSRYEGNIGDCFCGPIVAANPRGGEVYITGLAHGALAATDTATVAYDPATGTQKWAAIYNEAAGTSGSVALAVSPTGGRVFVGGAQRASGPADLVALAYTGTAPTAVPVAIRGRVTLRGGVPLSGVAVKLSGSGSTRTATDANGVYVLKNLRRGGVYGVTPARAGYRFRPAKRVVVLGGSPTSLNFTAVKA